MENKKILKIVFGALSAFALVFLVFMGVAWVLAWVWNHSLSTLFEIPQITLWQTLALMFFILFLKVVFQGSITVIRK